MANRILSDGESVLFALRELYGRRGYSHYRMNKFEEYDLYARNKDFLISDSVITFTDGNGKLLALKPDVTLSIVKNTVDDVNSLKKLYYNENVYRINKGSRNFKEIMQVGLECIGRVNDYCIYEVMKLALRSLDVISERNVLAVSHLGILSEIIDGLGIPASEKAGIFALIGEKNSHELGAVLSSFGVSDEKIGMLRSLIRTVGRPVEVLPHLEALLRGVVSDKTLSDFVNVITALADERNLIIDFSTVSDIKYYNGFVFKGFIEGIPLDVLTGGQYDRLMRKMRMRSLAIGFAVYLDTVEQYLKRTEEYDVDTLLLYSPSTPLAEVGAAVERMTAGGLSVLADISVPEGIKYRKLQKYENGEVTDLENDA